MMNVEVIYIPGKLIWPANDTGKEWIVYENYDIWKKC